MNRKITPEEKLLHIIEKPEEAAKSGLHKKGKVFNLGRSLGLFKKIGLGRITLHGVNKTLILASVVITVALVFLFIRGEKFMQARFEDLKEDIKKETFQLTKRQQEIPDLSTYLSNIETNNPFHVLPQVKTPEAEIEEEGISLKLVGIIWSDRPQAIIEDEISTKNYLVYEGDTVDKFSVIEIKPDEVKLSSEDGEKILR